MYFLVVGFLRLISLIPLPVLYLISDLLYAILYYGIGYRKQVVRSNLAVAFPEKTEEERRLIMKAFYHNFCDTFMEMIKMFSWSKEEIKKRFQGNIEVLNEWVGTNRNVQVVSGHYFNWEIANLGFGAISEMPFVVVYMPLRNKAFDKVVYDLRGKTGTKLVSATDFQNQVRKYLKQQYALTLVGDQNPGIPAKAYWTNFFGKPAPFPRGPEQGAKRNDTALIYVEFYKVKRGYYGFKMELLTSDPKSFKEGAITRMFVDKIEDSIRLRPDNYLWSHRRWKHEWKEEYRKMLID